MLCKYANLVEAETFLITNPNPNPNAYRLWSLQTRVSDRCDQVRSEPLGEVSCAKPKVFASLTTLQEGATAESNKFDETEHNIKHFKASASKQLSSHNIMAEAVSTSV